MLCPRYQSVTHVTVIPPHVASICHVIALVNKVELSTEMRSSYILYGAIAVLTEVIKELEGRAIDAGTVTTSGLIDKLREAINSTGIQHLLYHVENEAAIANNGILKTKVTHIWMMS